MKCDKNEYEEECVEQFCSAVDRNVAAGTLCRLDDVAEDCSPPGPVIVRDNVG